MTKSPRLPAGRLIWWAVGAFTLSVLAVGALVHHRVSTDALASAHRQVESLARAAETSINRSVLAIDLTLSGLATLPGLLDAEGRLIDPSTAAGLLRGRVDQSLNLRDLVLFDRQGRALASADPATARLDAKLPPDFLAALRSQRAPQLVFSEPATSVSTGDKVIFMARPLGSATEGAGLLALAEVPVATLTTLVTPALSDPGVSITLEDDEGRLLASVPSNDSLLGHRNGVPLTASLASGAAREMPDRMTGAPAVVSMRPSLYQSLMVAAAISTAAVADRTADARSAVLSIGGLFIALGAVTGALAQLYLGRLRTANEERIGAIGALEEALASMDEGFLLWDAQDRLLYWNERYLTMFPYMHGTVARGVDVRCMAEAGSRGLLPDADDAQRQAWVEARISRHRSGAREFVQRRPDGRAISVVERMTATGGMVSIYRDVTRTTAAAEEIERARQRAEAANEAKSRFLATMSHEIRTPLNGILGMNSLLLETPLTDKQRHFAEIIRLSGDALLAIINDVLDMSRLEAGRMALDIGPCSPHRVLREAVLLLSPRAADKGVALTVDEAEGQDVSHETTLLGDAHRLSQIVLNLVGNAVKFTDQGSVVVRSRLTPKDGATVLWTLTVRDTGIGIPEQALPTLFDRFTQGDSSTSRRFGGSGLGLAICRQLLTLMDGEVEVVSQPGKGSTFTVNVPLRRQAERVEPVEPAPTPARSAARAGSPLRILVAEDHVVNQLLITELLSRMGHACDVVSDGLEAVRRARSGVYDLVLMDIQMPEMDGVQAARAIRELPGEASRVPIIAVSANVLPEQRELYLAAGMNDHVAKPIDRARLQEAIESATIAA